MRNLINNWQDVVMPIICIGLGAFIFAVMMDAISQF